MRRGHQGLGTRWDAVLSFWPPWTLQELRIQIFFCRKITGKQTEKEPCGDSRSAEAHGTETSFTKLDFCQKDVIIRPFNQ